MRLLHTLSAFFVLLAGSCATFFEQEIELDALPYERQLVLNTILSPQDSLIRADVFVTAPAVGDPPPNYPPRGRVRDALVRLEGPGGSASFALVERGGTYVLPDTLAQLEAGRTYEVIAEWDGLVARGRTVIPERLTPRDSIMRELVVEDDGDRNVLATWPNQPGEQDYYFLYTERSFRSGNRQQAERYLADYIHGRDALGPYISGTLGVTTGYNNTLSICQCTQATYDYFLTRGTLEVNDDNPFAEPTTVANNLEEGLGLVGATNCWQFQY